MRGAQSRSRTIVSTPLLRIIFSMLGAQTEFQPSFVQLSDFMITIFCHSCEDFNRTSPCERLAYFKHKLYFLIKKIYRKVAKRVQRVLFCMPIS
jgi:G:T-mismatch repair DNA endonuclease (very short patch repair protein)